MSRAPNISVVLVTRNEGRNLRRTVEQFDRTLPRSGEIVVVDDGSTDRSMESLRRSRRIRLIRSARAAGGANGCSIGAARARNLGARRSRGDVLVFADAHIDPPEGWWAPMTDLLRKPSIGAVAPAVSERGRPRLQGFGLRLSGPDLRAEWLGRKRAAPHPVPLLPGCCLAMRRDTFEATGGFDEGMIEIGLEDTELCLRLWLFGYESWLVPGVVVPHLFRENKPYKLGWPAFMHNKLRMAFAHFGGARIRRIVEALRDSKGFSGGLALTVLSDVSKRRRLLESRRLHDDEWFLRKFGDGW